MTRYTRGPFSRANTGLVQYSITALLLLFGFALLIKGIDAMHMRPDEHLTFANMRFDFAQSMHRLVTRNNQAPIWWMNIWLWQRLVGTSEFAGRINSLLISMLTLSMVYQMSRAWFGRPRYGWFAIAVLSVNSYFFIYALEIRMYALVMLLTALSMRFFFAWMTQRTWRAALIYGISTSLMLYAHYYLAFVVLAQAVYFAIFHMWDGKLVKQGLGAASSAAIAWLPGAVILINQLRFIRLVERGGLAIPTEPSNFESIIELAQLSSSGQLGFYLLIAGLGLGLLWRNASYRLALVWLLVSPGLVLLINTQAPIYTQRYTSFFAPSVAIVVGAALAALPARWHWGGLILVCGMSLSTLPHHLPVRTPYRDIFTEISSSAQPDDILFVQHPIGDTFRGDQLDRYIAPQLLDNHTSSLEAAMQARRIWFLADDWFDTAVQSTFRTLETRHRLQQVIGDCNPDWCYLAQLLVAPPYREAIYFGETIGFLGADILPIEDEKLAAMLWWEVGTQPQHDYAISLQLIDANGRLVAQLDRQIQPPDFEEIPTSQLQPHNNYVDWRELQLPSDLPAGDYTLQVVVYQWWDNQRLLLPDGRDTFKLDTITIERENP